MGYGTISSSSLIEMNYSTPTKKAGVLSIECWLFNGGIPIMEYKNPITKGSISSSMHPTQPGSFSLLNWLLKNLGIVDCHVGFRGCEDNPG